jgi:uncharacterized glyoxalase superfamily protein PhnB
VTARDWYAELFGIEAYFQRPDAENPAYVEFRIGDDEDEFGIIDRRYAPATMQPGPGGATLLWHVDDIEAAFARLKAMGATEYDPITKRESGFVTASVVDPFGNDWVSCTIRTTSKCSSRGQRRQTRPRSHGRDFPLGATGYQVIDRIAAWPEGGR